MRRAAAPLRLLPLLFNLLLAASAAQRLLLGQISDKSPAGTPVDGVRLRLQGPGVCGAEELRSGLSGESSRDFRLVYHREELQQNLERNPYLGLVSAKVLDREFKAMYELQVHLRCLRGTVLIKVEVSEQNINVPHSSCGNLTVDLDELTPLGTKVLHLKDRCSDTDKNGPVVFYASPESKLLHVVPRGGQVVLVGSLLGLSHVELRLYAKDGGDAALAGEPVFLHVNVLKHQLQRRKRTRRNVSEEPNFTVMVPDQAQVGDLVFTVPELRFQQRWFEVIPEAADSPVQIERDSGRLFLARHLQEPEDVTVKIQNRRGRLLWFVSVRPRCPSCSFHHSDPFPLTAIVLIAYRRPISRGLRPSLSPITM